MFYFFNKSTAAFVKSMDTARSRGVVQPCHAAVRNLFERAVNLLGSRADNVSEEGLIELIKDLISDPTHADYAKQVK